MTISSISIVYYIRLSNEKSYSKFLLEEDDDKILLSFEKSTYYCWNIIKNATFYKKTNVSCEYIRLV